MAMGNGDWWAVQYLDRPTFYLDADVQGFADEKGARKVASRVLFGPAEVSSMMFYSIGVSHLGREKGLD